MVTLKFNGGLGNQLFQYCFMLLLEKNGIQVVPDLCAYERNHIHGGFILNCMLKPEYQIKNGIELEESNEWNSLNYVGKIEKKTFGHIGNHFYEESFSSSGDVLKMCNKKSIYLEGWWQSFSYVSEVIQILKNRLNDQFGENLLSFYYQTQGKEAISIHVRRGDYVSNSDTKALYGNICTEQYYHGAVKLFENIAEKEFWVFSDDIEFSKSIFGEYENFNYVSSSPDDKAYIDMLKMSLCDHHIIANSSFSWWGAILGKPKGITVMPKIWNNRSKDNVLITNTCILLDNHGNRV